MKKLKKLIKKMKEENVNTCPACKGDGLVTRGTQFARCGDCLGTGKTN